MKTHIEELKYFQIAKKLNEKHHELLKERQLHFRGNLNSFALISLSQETPELGKSNLKTEIQGEKVLNLLQLDKPYRPTKEKNLQAYIINYSLNNNGILPFGDFQFVTSELAIKLEDKKRIVNDILAIDTNNNLAIIELKSERSNVVKKQTIAFEEKVVNPKYSLIKELIFELTEKNWSGKVRKIAIWPAPIDKSKTKVNNCPEIELYNYRIEKGAPINIEQVIFEIE